VTPIRSKPSAKYKHRHNRFPNISVKAYPELFLIVGLAPPDDGTDLAAQEAETFGRRPTPGHSPECLSLLILYNPGRAIAHDVNRISYFRRRDCGK
jgi:hypothetical protein